MKNYKKVQLTGYEKVNETDEVCAICGSYADLKAFKGKKVCRKCVLGVR